MHNGDLKNIIDSTFRANPAYTLVLFDRLPPEQREALNDLRKDPDFYGILRPRDESGWGIKSACRDTALLFLTLQDPGKLPSYVEDVFGDETNHAAAELVLDGVLQIEVEGDFVCGSDAYQALYETTYQTSASAEAEPSQESTGKLARLSIDALKYAQELEISDVTQLSARLYFYNRLPVSPHWTRIFPSPQAVKVHLGMERGGANRAMLDRHWSAITPSPQNDGWLVWTARHAPETAPRSPKRDTPKQTYKLYVSPDPRFIGEAFAAALAVFTELGVPHFKVGKDVRGLLRPDKIVSYFGTMDHLMEVAERLAPKLRGILAHGIPFTAELAGDGILSWGIDPPSEQQTLSWQERESWRLWITNRLATSLLSSRAARGSRSAAIEPWRFALERLHLEGIDTSSWTPAETIWQSV